MIYKLPQRYFDALAGHLDHKVYFVGYGKNARPPWENLALECEDCDCVIADWSPSDKKRPKKRRSG